MPLVSKVHLSIGKTTLAKLGIAKCLLDNEGNSRNNCFYSFRLCSNNGSTLEGHNYTYVGSTWGVKK